MDKVYNMNLPQLPAISEEDIAESSPRVRALILGRLEQVWNTVAPHVDGTRREEGEGTDVRFVEAGIRCLDRMASLYRLHRPVASQENSDRLGGDQLALVESGLAELEERMREAGK